RLSRLLQPAGVGERGHGHLGQRLGQAVGEDPGDDPARVDTDLLQGARREAVLAADAEFGLAGVLSQSRENDVEHDWRGLTAGVKLDFGVPGGLELAGVSEVNNTLLVNGGVAGPVRLPLP